MTQSELIAIANAHYPDGAVAEYFSNPGQDFGETLALHVVRDLEGLTDGYPNDDEQLEVAEWRMRRAIDDLAAVADGFARARAELRRKTGPACVPDRTRQPRWSGGVAEGGAGHCGGHPASSGREASEETRGRGLLSLGG